MTEPSVWHARPQVLLHAACAGVIARTGLQCVLSRVYCLDVAHLAKTKFGTAAPWVHASTLNAIRLVS